MRKPVSHTVFWFLVFLQDLFLILTLRKVSVQNIPENVPFWMAAKASLLLLLPKILLVYYFLNKGLDRLFSSGKAKLFAIAEAALVLTGSVILSRIIVFYIINPYIFIDKGAGSHLFAFGSLLASFIENGFVGAVAIAIKLSRLHRGELQRESGLVKEKLETELKFLRNQTNPHFLMNTLNNIYVLASKNSEETAEVVLKLSDLLRFMLYETESSYISLSDEIKVIEGYLDLEMIRYDHRLSVSFQKEIDNESYKIAPLLLLPFIENAFKHGVSESRFESFINIDIKVQKGLLHFFIENTSDNNQSRAQKHNIGLSNVRRQLELTYKDYRLDIKQEDNLFKAMIFINLFSHVEI